MRKKYKYKFLSGLLSLAMAASSVWGSTAFAEEIILPEAVEEIVLEEVADNGEVVFDDLEIEAVEEEVEFVEEESISEEEIVVEDIFSEDIIVDEIVPETELILDSVESEIQMETDEESVQNKEELNADEVVTSGTCGDNLTWNAVTDANGMYTLTISGTGEMDYWWDADEVPWSDFMAEDIETIEISADVTTIGNYAFMFCSNVKNIRLPESLISIGENAFYGCSGLTSITIPNNVDYIGEAAFSCCSRLTSITIPNKVTQIERDTFYGCSSLVSITIPNSVTSIEYYAFAGCNNLRSITIPNKITTICDFVFAGCNNLTYVVIPNSVTYIGEEAFRGCSSLTSITIPNNVDYIGEAAFAYCSSLTSITIPNKVEFIAEEAFNSCDSLSTIYFEGNAPEFDEGCFSGVIATAFYPENNNTWTLDVMKNYWGEITWLPWTPSGTITDKADQLKFTPVSETIVRHKSGTVYAPIKVMQGDETIVPDGIKVKYSVNNQTEIVEIKDGIFLAKMDNMQGVNTVEILSVSDPYEIGDDTVTVNVATKPYSYVQEFDLSVDFGISGTISKILGFEVGTDSKISISYDSFNNVLTLSRVGVGKGSVSDKKEFSSSAVKNFDTSIKGAYGFSKGEIHSMTIENYSLVKDNEETKAKIGYFLLQCLMPVGGKVTHAELEKLYYDVYSEFAGSFHDMKESVGITRIVSANDTMSGKLGGFSFDLSAQGSNTAYSTSVVHDLSDGTITYSSSAETADNSRLLDTSILTKAGISVGTSVFGTDLRKSSSDISIEKVNGGVSELSVSSIDKNYDAVIGTSCSATKESQISYTGSAASNVIQSNSKLSNLANGAPLLLSQSDITKVYSTLDKSEGIGEYQDKLTYEDSLSLDLSLGIVSASVSGAKSYEFETNKGLVVNGVKYTTVDNEASFPAGTVWGLGYSVPDILSLGMSGISAFLSDVVSYKVGNVFDGIQDKAAEVWSDIKNSWNGTIAVMTYGSNTYAVSEMHLLALAESEETSTAASIGNAYTIKIYSDANQEVEVSAGQLAQSPVMFSLSYEDADLPNAGISSAQENQIGICHWSEAEQAYVFVEGCVVDTEANTVKAQLPENGEYILAIDTVAPQVTEFVVSDNTELPVLMAYMSDFSGISECVVTLDGEIVLSENEFKGYLENSGKLVYPIKKALESGEHTATILLTDNNGNSMESAISLTWIVDNSKPVFTFITCSDIPDDTCETVTVQAHVTDDNLSSVYAQIVAGGTIYTLPADTEDDEVWEITLTRSEYGRTMQVLFIATDETGNKSVSGTNWIEFLKWDIAQLNLNIPAILPVAYTGQSICPEIGIIGLQKDLDYSVTYRNNVEPGTATIIINGIGDYTGTITKTFVIKECEHSWKDIIDQAATCGTAGSQHQECSVCRAKQAAIVIPATGKHEGVTERIEPTYFADGAAITTCKACKAHLKTETLEKLTYTVTKEADKLTLGLNKTIKASKLISGLVPGDYITNVTTSKSKYVEVKKSGNDWNIKGKKVTSKKTTADITITLASGASAKITFSVQKNAVKASTLKVTNVSKNKVTLTVGDTMNLEALVKPVTAGDATFSTSNKKIVTVSKTGQIAAKKAGTATITVKAGGKSVKVKVTVKKTAPTSFTLSKTVLNLKVKKSVTLKAKFKPSGSEGKVTFKSSAPKIAAVNKTTGKITAKKKGTAIITATVKSATGEILTQTCKVTVKK